MTPRGAEAGPQARPFWLLGAGFAALLLLSAAQPFDLWISAWFYRPSLQAWPWRAALPWRWLYRYGAYPALLLAAAALAGLLGSIWRPAWRRYRRAWLVVVLTVALAPGLLVNGILKPWWGRPRPRQVTDFGGTRAYRPWWRPGGPGAGKSFPSGHAAIGYALAAGTCLIACRRSRLRSIVLAGTVAYGTLVGCARIVQGGHFASDIFGAGVVTFGTIALLAQGLLRVPAGAREPGRAPGQSSAAPRHAQ